MRMIDADKLPSYEIHINDADTGEKIIMQVVFLKDIQAAPTLGSDCENCGKVSTCKHVLGHPATITRINCPLWRPKK